MNQLTNFFHLQISNDSLHIEQTQSSFNFKNETNISYSK